MAICKRGMPLLLVMHSVRMCFILSFLPRMVRSAANERVGEAFTTAEFRSSRRVVLLIYSTCRRFYARLAQLKIETFQVPFFKIQLNMNGNIYIIILNFLICSIISCISENLE